MIYIIIAFLIGVTIVVSRVMNARLADEIGALHGSLINHAVGLIISCLFVLCIGQFGTLTFENFAGVKWWGFMGGLSGVLVVALSSYASSRSTALTMTVIVFAGQLLSGAIIDYFLLGMYSTGKIIGGLIVIAGLYVFMSPSKNILKRPI